VQNGWQPGPDTQQRIDEAVRNIVMQAFERATELLQERRELLDRCAQELLVRETLDADMLKTLTGLPTIQPSATDSKPSYP
jgi:cell division protease FtsH